MQPYLFLKLYTVIAEGPNYLCRTILQINMGNFESSNQILWFRKKKQFVQCLCYVQDDVYVRFLELFSKAVATLKVSEKTGGSKCIKACKNIYFRRVYRRILRDVTKKGKMSSLPNTYNNNLCWTPWFTSLFLGTFRQILPGTGSFGNILWRRNFAFFNI